MILAKPSFPLDDGPRDVLGKTRGPRRPRAPVRGLQTLAARSRPFRGSRDWPRYHAPIHTPLWLASGCVPASDFGRVVASVRVHVATGDVASRPDVGRAGPHRGVDGDAALPGLHTGYVEMQVVKLGLAAGRQEHRLGQHRGLGAVRMHHMDRPSPLRARQPHDSAADEADAAGFERPEQSGADLDPPAASTRGRRS